MHFVRTVVILALVAVGVMVAAPAFAITTSFHDTGTYSGTTVDVRQALALPLRMRYSETRPRTASAA
jgi:hypothetical protein